MYLINPIQPITFVNHNECIWICSSLSAFCMWSYHCRCIGQSGWKVHSSSAVRQFWVASSPIRSEFFISKVVKLFSSFTIEWFWRNFYGRWVLVLYLITLLIGAGILVSIFNVQGSKMKDDRSKFLNQILTSVCFTLWTC